MRADPSRVAWGCVGAALAGLSGYLAYFVFVAGTIKMDPDLEGAAYWAELLRLVKLQPLGVVLLVLFVFGALAGVAIMVRAVAGRRNTLPPAEAPAAPAPNTPQRRE